MLERHLSIPFLPHVAFLSIVTSVALAVPNLNVEWAIGPDSELKFGSEIKKPLETQGACEDGGSSQN
jgi:hypothetical protein